MPNLATHYICGKIIKEILNIKSDTYLVGCILPDYIENSHYKKKGTLFSIPDIDLFINETDITDINFLLGYLTHLLLDKHFIEDFITKELYEKRNIKEYIFTEDKIYKEYTIISPHSLKEYNININEIRSCLINKEYLINQNKFNHDIECIENSTSNLDDLTYLNLKELFNFIDKTSIKIANELQILQKELNQKKQD